MTGENVLPVVEQVRREGLASSIPTAVAERAIGEVIAPALEQEEQRTGGGRQRDGPPVQRLSIPHGAPVGRPLALQEGAGTHGADRVDDENGVLGGLWLPKAPVFHEDGSSPVGRAHHAGAAERP